MMKIRKYKESDLYQVASVISSTFRKFNYNDNLQTSSEGYADFYDPQTGLEEIRKIFSSSTNFLIAEKDEQIVGILRANENRIVNLFVIGNFHRQGIGRQLIQHFENECRKMEYSEIVLRSQLYAIPFYQACGYKKTTGIRMTHGLTIQPMKKILHG